MNGKPHTEYDIVRWLQNHQHELMLQAVEDIDTTDALSGAVKLKANGKEGLISRTQLTALLNMARTQKAEKIKEHIKVRIKRRRDTGKHKDAEFWAALLDIIKKLKVKAVLALSESGILKPDSHLLKDTETKIIGAYLEHFVSHCRYRIHFIVEEDQNEQQV